MVLSGSFGARIRPGVSRLDSEYSQETCWQLPEGHVRPMKGVHGGERLYIYIYIYNYITK